MDFSWIHWTPKDINTAAEAALAQKKSAYDAVKAIPAPERTFANTIAALEEAGDPLSDVIQQLGLLIGVHPDQAIRDAAQETSDRIEATNVDLEFDRDLWRAVSDLAVDAATLPPEDKKLYDDTLRDMRRMGFALPDDQFEQLKQLSKDLQKLEQEFETTINNYSDQIELTREQLAGLPERYIDSLIKTADGKYIVSLQYPHYFPFMQLADDTAARKELNNKNLRKGGVENMERLAQMIRLRQKSAGLLGYKNHSDYVTEVRMAGTTATVRGFIEDILTKLALGVHADLRELVDIKKRFLNLEKPAPVHYYETAYWAHKLKKERYDLDSEKVKEYFPLDHTFDGIMRIYQDLLGLKFTPATDIPVWHPDVRTYTVHDAASDALLGYFFLDFYPREGKYGHAAAFPISIGQIKAVALVCNFSKPTPSNPSLLSHEEVETLLHEFGHVMHAVVSENKYQRQNGFGVAMDFIEALSQIFEYLAWGPRPLKQLSRHYETGQPLSDEMIQKVIEGRRFQKASYYTRQAAMALYDILMHSMPVDALVDSAHLAKLGRDVALAYEHQDLPDDAIRAAGWGHMADYDAGYYGYLWSKVYAADMFTRFASNPLDTAAGHEYRAKVLAPGASRPEKQLVEDFLGRSSTNTAFLDEIGIE